MLYGVQVTDISTSTIHGQIAGKKPLLKNTNNKKRLAWAKKHKQWTLDWWKSALWSDESKFEMFGSSCSVFVRRRAGEQDNDLCMCGSH
jgi:hypothetical protein